MRDLWQNQLGNLFFWTPFLMAFGAGLYFNLSHEPDFISCIIGLIISAVLICIKIPKLVRGIVLFIFGFCYASVFTHMLNTPQISHSIHNIEVTGTVQRTDYTDEKSRLYIKTDANQIGAGDGTAIVRVSSDAKHPTPNIGDKISATIGLFRPDGADAPETFDYARWAYFNKITATGYINKINVIEAANSGGISGLRDYIHRYTNSFLADTLVLGYKNAVPKSDAEIWTATGIGHVWSISGFHITLVSAWLLAIFYLIFRSIPQITKRTPARIPALICAWVGLLFYVILSGSDVATIRAFIMATLIFVAFIFGRNAISMRNVCIAFLILFLMNPHFVMQAGFQLSFAAIFGLVWLWNDLRPKMPHNKILKIIYTAVLTSLVATIFTAPFVVAHFYNLPIYSLIGNLVLLPIFSVAIMPLICVGVVTAGVGWTWPIDAAHSIYNFCLNIGESIANIPSAILTLPHIPNIALVLIIIGFLCIMFIRPIKMKINYILGGVFICGGITVIATYPKPIFYATADHELVAFVNQNTGTLEFSKSRASNHYFTFDTWKQINGDAVETKNIRRKPIDGVWIYETQNFTLAYIQKFVPVMKNINSLCKNENIDYIVSYFDINAPKCNHKILRGGFVIYPSGTVKYVYHLRPWHNPHE